MKEYAVEVVERYELRRTYYIKATSKTEARILAKDNGWYDARDGWEEDGLDIDYLPFSPELQGASIKKIREVE